MNIDRRNGLGIKTNWIYGLSESTNEHYGIKIEYHKNFESFCYGYLEDNIWYLYIIMWDYEKIIYDTE